MGPLEITMVLFFFAHVGLSRSKMFVTFYVPKHFVLWHLHLLHYTPVIMRTLLAVVRRKSIFTVARCFWRSTFCSKVLQALLLLLVCMVYAVCGVLTLLSFHAH